MQGLFFSCCIRLELKIRDTKVYERDVDQKISIFLKCFHNFIYATINSTNQRDVLDSLVKNAVVGNGTSSHRHGPHYVSRNFLYEARIL